MHILHKARCFYRSLLTFYHFSLRRILDSNTK
jgi:hypothetical protein